MQLGLTRQQRRVAKALVAYLMLALWCITAAQVASPQLHHLLHKDSQKSTHECLVTQLTKSAQLAGGIPIVVAAPAPICVYAFCSELQYFPVPDHRVSPSRAPPAVSSSTRVIG